VGQKVLAWEEKRSRARSWLSWLQVRREGWRGIRTGMWGVARVGVRVVRRRRRRWRVVGRRVGEV